MTMDAEAALDASSWDKKPCERSSMPCSGRWRTGRFTHRLELYRVEDVDDEVQGWLKDACSEVASRGIK
jgi:hypothetical protein